MLSLAVSTANIQWASQGIFRTAISFLFFLFPILFFNPLHACMNAGMNASNDALQMEKKKFFLLLEALSFRNASRLLNNPMASTVWLG